MCLINISHQTVYLNHMFTCFTDKLVNALHCDTANVYFVSSSSNNNNIALNFSP